MVFRYWIWLTFIFMCLISIPMLSPKNIWFENKKISNIMKVFNVFILVLVFGMVIKINSSNVRTSRISYSLDRENMISLNDNILEDKDVISTADENYFDMYNISWKEDKLSFIQYVKSKDNGMTQSVVRVPCTEVVTTNDTISLSDDNSYYTVGDFKFVRDEDKKLDSYLNNSTELTIYYNNGGLDTDDVIQKYIVSK